MRASWIRLPFQFWIFILVHNESRTDLNNFNTRRWNLCCCPYVTTPHVKSHFHTAHWFCARCLCRSHGFCIFCTPGSMHEHAVPFLCCMSHVQYHCALVISHTCQKCTFQRFCVRFRDVYIILYNVVAFHNISTLFEKNGMGWGRHGRGGVGGDGRAYYSLSNFQQLPTHSWRFSLKLLQFNSNARLTILSKRVQFNSNTLLTLLS